MPVILHWGSTQSSFYSISCRCTKQPCYAWFACNDQVTVCASCTKIRLVSWPLNTCFMKGEGSMCLNDACLSYSWEIKQGFVKCKTFFSSLTEMPTFFFYFNVIRCKSSSQQHTDQCSAWQDRYVEPKMNRAGLSQNQGKSTSFLLSNVNFVQVEKVNKKLIFKGQTLFTSMHSDLKWLWKWWLLLQHIFCYEEWVTKCNIIAYHCPCFWEFSTTEDHGTDK